MYIFEVGNCDIHVNDKDNVYLWHLDHYIILEGNKYGIKLV
jgi:hypothetical protein